MAEIKYVGNEALNSLISHIPDLDVSFGINVTPDPEKPRKVTLAQKYPVFTGTYSEYETNKETIPNGTVVILTDADHLGIYEYNNGELNVITPSRPEVDGITITYNDDGQLVVTGSAINTHYLDAECNGTIATVTSTKYIGGNADYLLTAYCDDKDRYIVSREINGNTLTIEYDDVVTNVIVAATAKEASSVGDMHRDTYDSDEDGIIDVAASLTYGDSSLTAEEIFEEIENNKTPELWYSDAEPTGDNLRQGMSWIGN